MSIPVAVDNIAEALRGFGSGYVVSTHEGRAKVIAVNAAISGQDLIVSEPGGGTRRNIAENAAVTVVFPPLAERGFTLLVDGVARVNSAGVSIRPTSAILHRPAPHLAPQPTAGA